VPKDISPPAAVPAASEPTDADLQQILAGGVPAVAPKAKAKAAPAPDPIEDDDPDLEQDDPEDGDPADPAPAATVDDDAVDTDAGEDDGEAAEAAAPDADPAAANDEPDADTSLDSEDKQVRAKFTPEQQARFDKAVSKKTRRILELKSELADEQRERERLAAELETAGKSVTSAATVATPDNPLAALDDEAKLDTRLGEARKLRRFALANPDGAFVDKTSGEVVEVEDPENPPANVVAFSKKRIGAILADTEEILQEHGPKHRKFLQDRAAAEADAVKQFPWLKNKTSQGYVAVEATLRAAPQLRAIPGIKHLLADAFIGRSVRLAAQQQAAKGKTESQKSKIENDRKAPPSPGGGARPARIAGAQKLAGQAAKTVADTGDDPDNAALRAILKS
jgi:hypothetical protein